MKQKIGVLATLALKVFLTRTNLLGFTLKTTNIHALLCGCQSNTERKRCVKLMTAFLPDIMLLSNPISSSQLPTSDQMFTHTFFITHVWAVNNAKLQKRKINHWHHYQFQTHPILISTWIFLAPWWMQPENQLTFCASRMRSQICSGHLYSKQRHSNHR